MACCKEGRIASLAFGPGARAPSSGPNPRSLVHCIALRALHCVVLRALLALPTSGAGWILGVPGVEGVGGGWLLEAEGDHRDPSILLLQGTVSSHGSGVGWSGICVCPRCPILLAGGKSWWKLLSKVIIIIIPDSTS